MSKPLDILCGLLTKSEIEKIEKRLWKRMTDGNGYQAFGDDASTLWATHPEEMEVRASLSEAYRELVKRESLLRTTDENRNNKRQ